MNQFGDERKISLTSRLTPAQAEAAKFLCDEVQPVMLGVALWECCEPWQVPERRINDNFILAVRHGEEAVTVNGRRAILRRGDWMAVPEFVPHSFGLAPGCANAGHFICHTLFSNFAVRNPFRLFRTPFLHFRHPDAEFEALERIAALRDTAPDSALRMAGWKFKEWVLEAIDDGNFTAVPPPIWDERIHSAVDFIERNCADDIGTPEIARAAGLGEVRLRTLFLASTGMTPRHFLIRTRLLRAARLLAGYEYRVEEVAERSGFSSAAYFCSVFKKFFGRSPGEFRTGIRQS